MKDNDTYNHNHFRWWVAFAECISEHRYYSLVSLNRIVGADTTANKP